jgi:hypothetical protein
VCYTCGCKRPFDDMGSRDNIIEDYFERAGSTEAIGQAGSAKAKQNMLELLQLEQEKNELGHPAKQY